MRCCYSKCVYLECPAPESCPKSKYKLRSWYPAQQTQRPSRLPWTCIWVCYVPAWQTAEAAVVEEGQACNLKIKIEQAGLPQGLGGEMGGKQTAPLANRLPAIGRPDQNCWITSLGLCVFPSLLHRCWYSLRIWRILTRW
jgi:hypothetical protein